MPREAERACYSAPFILESPGAAPELIVTSTTSITSYHPDDGSQNWRWQWKFKGDHPLRTVASPLCAIITHAERIIAVPLVSEVDTEIGPILVESADDEGTIVFHPASMKDEPAGCEFAI